MILSAAISTVQVKAAAAGVFATGPAAATECQVK
jgi:hypothetical protein